MHRPFNARELAAIAPLLELARAKDKVERDLWINDLRQDAPVLMARIEAMLDEEARAVGVASMAEAPVGARRRRDTMMPRALGSTTLGWLGR